LSASNEFYFIFSASPPKSDVGEDDHKRKKEQSFIDEDEHNEESYDKYNDNEVDEESYNENGYNENGYDEDEVATKELEDYDEVRWCTKHAICSPSRE